MHKLSKQYFEYWPLYYGTLYGPLVSLVYFQVKAKIVEEGRYFIPTSPTSTSVITSNNANTDTDIDTSDKLDDVSKKFNSKQS